MSSFVLLTAPSVGPIFFHFRADFRKNWITALFTKSPAPWLPVIPCRTKKSPLAMNGRMLWRPFLRAAHNTVAWWIALLNNRLAPPPLRLAPPSLEFYLNVFTEFSKLRYKNIFHYSKRTRTCHLLCKRPECFHSTSKTHVRDRIFTLNPIHASVIYQVPWICWIHRIQWKFCSI